MYRLFDHAPVCFSRMTAIYRLVNFAWRKMYNIASCCVHKRVFVAKLVFILAAVVSSVLQQVWARLYGN